MRRNSSATELRFIVIEVTFVFRKAFEMASNPVKEFGDWLKEEGFNENVIKAFEGILLTIPA